MVKREVYGPVLLCTKIVATFRVVQHLESFYFLKTANSEY